MLVLESVLVLVLEGNILTEGNVTMVINGSVVEIVTGMGVGVTGVTRVRRVAVVGNFIVTDGAGKFMNLNVEVSARDRAS